MILKCIKVVAAAAFALVSLNVSGQDLLARQAPIDRKLKAVDSVALIRQIKAEKAAYPAYYIGTDYRLAIRIFHPQPLHIPFILTGATSVYTLTVIPLLSLILSVLI